ncbi:MAG: hypothetical protein JO250_05400 [Armatimonadetes bacterium]|nr:hypothetical protein [Armatimonadota bacterium]
MIMGMLAVLLLCAAWVFGVFVIVVPVIILIGVLANLAPRNMGRLAVSSLFVVAFGGEGIFLVHESHRLGHTDYADLGVAVVGLAAITVVSFPPFYVPRAE